jgi:hypothetical protein
MKEAKLNCRGRADKFPNSLGFVRDKAPVTVSMLNDKIIRPFCLSVRLSVYLSVRIEQLGSHWTEFHEI